MQIVLENTGRRFNKEWIFRKVHFTFSETNPCAVLGANGSGKSTFLQLVAGYLIPSEGTVSYSNPAKIENEKIYQQISIASPALELFEDFTLAETIKFHSRLKSLFPDIDLQTLPELLQLSGQENKQLRFFSSGMKQRVKLGLAILSNTPVLFLDEPTINLDRNGVEWYQKMIRQYSTNRVVLVASNKVEEDYFFCNTVLEMEKLKG